MAIAGFAGSTDSVTANSAAAERCEALRVLGEKRFVARFAFRNLREVVPQIGAGIVKDSIRRWIRRGLLRAYRLPGIRGPLFDELEFEQDFASVRAAYLRVTRLVARSLHDEEENIG